MMIVDEESSKSVGTVTDNISPLSSSPRSNIDLGREAHWDERAAFADSGDRLESDEKRKPSLWEERSKWWKIYSLRFLFVWNTRTYEYASIILVSLAFPQSLTAASIRGITSTVSSLLCASAVGSWIDRSSSRVTPLLASIFANHGAIVAAYLCWLIWPSGSSAEESQEPVFNLAKGFLFGFILLIDVIQDLSALANKLSLERDCVPVLVLNVTSGAAYSLTQVNAVMSRLDLLCKLVAPSLLPLVITKSQIQNGWILLLIGVTIVLWGLEIWLTRVIARENARLHLTKQIHNDSGSSNMTSVDGFKCGNHAAKFSSWLKKMHFLYQGPVKRLRNYFSMQMWPASFCIALFQMTILAYSSTLITYLFEVGFSITTVTIARASGSIMALASTFATPLIVRYLRKRRRSRSSGLYLQGQDNDDGSIVRKVGLWGVLFQLSCTIPVVIVLWYLSSTLVINAKSPRDTSASGIHTPHLIPTLALFAFLSLSRIGHSMFDLMVQEMEQVEIPAAQRSTFAGTEQSFDSLFSLCHWGATILWNKPEDFRWLALGSCSFLGAGTVIYTFWIRQPRTSSGPEYEEVPLHDVER